MWSRAWTRTMSTANVPASAARSKALTLSNILEELPTVREEVQAAVTTSFSKSKKRGTSALRKTKSGYLLFCDKTRPVLSASAPQDKLKELGERWQSLSVADKQPYEDQAKAIREEAKKTAVAEEIEAEFPMRKNLRNEGELDRFVARITRASIKGFLEDLMASAEQGKTYTIPKVGSLKLKKADEKDDIILHLKSFQARKRIAEFLREPLPDDFIPPPPQAASACGDVDDVVHGDLNSTPST